MFTGIIETLGTVTKVEHDQSNIHFFITSSLSKELKIDQSVSHNGVCLTVVNVQADSHQVTAIQETLTKSNLGTLKVGDLVNIERCTLANGRFDGHIVQGHVDQTAICTAKEDQHGSWLFTFEYDPTQQNITVEKGSITVNGISLTVLNSTNNSFAVAIIPYTIEHTNLQHTKVGDSVNLEFDIVGKYVSKIMAMRG
ncbi:riboflavin synthase [Sphingobacterium bambusae]|uniref:Riboflavin synthase n=1 Tax=Sphingobacterium bambusae TaxID=662858 RepID=A0ABW6BGN5_9SPHI|nr:riboflavin synthase [Sphingobacterium bambusae]WPL49804.1 riboflavin synthase [Sphingobacterium bambusae]